MRYAARRALSIATSPRDPAGAPVSDDEIGKTLCDRPHITEATVTGSRGPRTVSVVTEAERQTTERVATWTRPGRGRRCDHRTLSTCAHRYVRCSLGECTITTIETRSRFWCTRG